MVVDPKLFASLWLRASFRK